MAGGLPINRRLSLARRAAYLLVLLMLPALAAASGPSPADPPAANDAAAADTGAADTGAAEAANADAEDTHAQDAPLLLSSNFGPPGRPPDVPPPEELEAARRR